MRSILAGLRTLVLPWGFTTGPRIVLSGDSVPSTLVAASTDFQWSAAIVEYVSTTDYKFEAVGTFVGGGGPFEIYAEGTYDTIHGVMFGTILQNLAAGTSLFYLYGSLTYNAFPTNWQWRHGTVTFASSITQFANQATLNISNAIDAYTPGGGGGTEQWNFLGYQNGWSDFGAGFAVGQYRYVASPPRCVQLVGTLKPGTKTAGTVMFNLPAGYRPAHTNLIPIVTDVSIAGGQSPAILIAPSGDVQVYGIGGTTSFICLNVVFPLDLN